MENNTANDGTDRFELDYSDMQNLHNHCTTLKDFTFTSIQNCIKLHRNEKRLSAAIQPLLEEATLLDERKFKLDDELRNPILTPVEREEKTKSLEEVRIEIKAFKIKKHEVYLYTLKASGFPNADNEREKFTMKNIPLQNGGNVQLPYITAFLELTDIIIVGSQL